MALDVRFVSIDPDELKKELAAELKAVAKLNRTPKQKRQRVKRWLINFLDARIEGGPVVEAVSDVAIRLLVGILGGLVEKKLAEELGFLRNEDEEDEQGRPLVAAAAEPEPEPEKPAAKA